MSAPVAILLLALFAAVLVWTAWDVVRDLLMMIDPEGEADRILAERHGDDPAALDAARDRFDANRVRNLFAISAGGAVGLLGTLFILFG
jgi:hypothetical protein